MSAPDERDLFAVGTDLGLDAFPERVRGTLYAVAEYDGSAFNVLYLSTEVRGAYDDPEQMTAHFERIHDYVNVDFTERELFTEALFPEAERVDYLVTRMDDLKLVRIYDGRQGLLLSLDPDEPVVPLVEPVLEELRD